MNIKNISPSQSFKAQLSPEVKEGFSKLLENTNLDGSYGKKILQNMHTIVTVHPDDYISIGEYNLQGDIYYGYMHKSATTKKTHGISKIRDTKEELFSLKHLEDIVAEFNQKAQKMKYEDIKKLLKEKLSGKAD